MVYFAFQKTADGNGESYGSEVFIMRSKDLLELHDLDKPHEATWETLPKGDKGWLVWLPISQNNILLLVSCLFTFRSSD